MRVLLRCIFCVVEVVASGVVWSGETVLSLSLSLSIYIYIYMCVCVCVCVWFVIGWLMGEVFAFSDEYLKFSVVLFRKASG